MIYIIAISASLLFVSAILVLWRITRGPTSLDRIVGVDMMTSILIGGFALLAAVTRRADLLAVFVVISIIGFVGSTALARFARPIDPELRRILSLEEEEKLDQESEQITDDVAPVHDVDVDDDEDDAEDPDGEGVPEEEAAEEEAAEASTDGVGAGSDAEPEPAEDSEVNRA